MSGRCMSPHPAHAEGGYSSFVCNTIQKVSPKIIETLWKHCLRDQEHVILFIRLKVTGEKKPGWI